MLIDPILLGAAVLTVIAAVQAVSIRLLIPQTMLIALVGICCGMACLASVAVLPREALAFVSPILAWRMPAENYLALFLPTLLFQAAMSANVRDMAADWAPILLLAVFAVFVATAMIGLVASGISGHPLTDGLLLGSVVATTDASAVIAVFRSVGAPSRLTTLVEGESLLNDSAAISIAGVILASLTGSIHMSGEHFALGSLTVSFLGGAAFGALAGRLFAWVVVYLGGEGKAELTLTLALPYPLYLVGDRILHVSGVVSVVAAGLIVSGLGRTRLSPKNWQHLQFVWEQIAALAGTVAFLLAAIQIPEILKSIRPFDVLTLIGIVAAALCARLAVLFGLFPMLAKLHLSEPGSPALKFVIAWGGLRGAVTITLAMGIAQNTLLPESTRRFVAVLAVGFVLFSLMINGPSLKWLIERLRLNALSRQDQALQTQVVLVSSKAVEDQIITAAAAFNIGPDISHAVVSEYRESILFSTPTFDIAAALTQNERLIIGCIALAKREYELIPNYGSGIVATGNLDAMTRNTAKMIEEARHCGPAGYQHAASRILLHTAGYRFATVLRRFLRLDKPFSNALGNHFELLICRRAVLEELCQYNRTVLSTLLDHQLIDDLDRILASRVVATERALNETRVQFKQYTRRLEHRMLLLLALKKGRAEVGIMHEERSISTEIYDSLIREFSAAWSHAIVRPPFDALPDVDHRKDRNRYSKETISGKGATRDD